MDKILQSASTGDIIVTNDGATILKSISLDNAAAKALVNVSITQDNEIGDGTTSVTVLAAELLREAERLIDTKIHPQTIIDGYRIAANAALNALYESAVDHKGDSEVFRKDLENIARTTLSSKILSQDKDYFSKLAVEAILRLKSVNLESIQIIKKAGGRLRDSYLDEGFILEKRIGVNQPKRLENAKILVANTPMDTDKVKVFGARVRVDATGKLAELEKAEKEKMKAKVEKIKAHGINCFVNRQLIYNWPEQLFADAGMISIEHADFDGIERLALVTGGEIVSTFDHPEHVKLGRCDLIEEVIIGEDKMIKFSGVAAGEACTIVLRWGATSQLLDEAERSLHDALAVLSQTLGDFKVTLGGGCSEILMAKAVDAAASKESGKKMHAIEAFARALRIIPTILASNAGFDAGELVSRLRFAHYKGACYIIGDFANKRSETGFKGHPECGFCKRSFYDDDDLYKHCRECHERCHVCDQIAGKIKHQYYLNYDSLERHFREDHYICPETECLEKRFIVFGTEIDLKVHQLEVHKNNLSSKALKEAKKIPMSFVFDCPGTFKYFKGKNIAGTSNELLNYDEHMTRAERALKRQEENALQESRKISVLLGDSISTGSPVQSVVVGSSNSCSVRNYIMSNGLKDEEFPRLNGKVSTKLKELSISNENELNTSFLCSSFFNYDSKMASQYSVILNNISNLLKNIEQIKQFCSSVSAFSNSTITAIEFVEVLWILFKGRLEEIGRVLSQFVDLIHNDNKKSELLIAWNDWKIKKNTQCWAFQKGWIVLAIPRGLDIVNNTTSFFYHKKTNLWRQPEYTSFLLDGFAKANFDILSKIFLSREYHIGTHIISKSTSLSEFLEIGVLDSLISHDILEIFLKELSLGNCPPVLLTFDNISATCTPSLYMSNEYKAIHPYDLALIRLFFTYLNGNLFFVQSF
ncbi:hypothetical protein PCK2_000216 [Pneumocystis canis]|nr:hypothetical protein PCK2_000216 [Pneumocystis canis]